jgi:hypothetical protein
MAPVNESKLMNIRASKPIVVALAAGYGLLGVPQANAQSADALIDKLVDKGILTAAEAQALREEADQGFTAAYQAKTGMPDYVNALRFNGDFRGRYDGIYKDGSEFTERHRWRYRMRFGLTVDLLDDFEVGFRLGSGDVAGLSAGSAGADPISQNQTLGGNAAKKGVFIDLAYASWSPLRGPDWNARTTIGKMGNPFTFSDIVFDGDYTPEGAAQTFGYRPGENHALQATGAAFMLNEFSARSEDPYFLGAQLRWDADWHADWETSLGAAFIAIGNRDGLGNQDVPNINAGNTRVPGATVPANATPAYGFNALALDAKVTYTIEHGIPFYPAKFPISLQADYVHNHSAPDDNTGYAVGLQLGKTGRRGLWELSYRYKRLEADYWYEEMLDSNSGGFYASALPNSGFGSGYRAGSNVAGHIVRAGYSATDSLTFGFMVAFMETINQTPGAGGGDIVRVLADAQFKF